MWIEGQNLNLEKIDEALKEASRSWYKDDYRKKWAHYALIRCKARAKLKNLEFSITECDLEIPIYCPILGIKIEINNGTHLFAAPNSPSVDRVNNTKGYVKGNVRVISNKANLRKSDLTLEQVKKLVQYMEN